MAYHSQHETWFYAPVGTTSEEAATFAYAQIVKDFGPGDDLPEDAQARNDHFVTRIKDRPDDAGDDWPEGTVLVLAMLPIVVEGPAQ